jgi:hypothetical protein
MGIDDHTTAADFLVLGTWEALTLLGEARELCDADDVAELLSKAEEILISVVSELPGHCPGLQGGLFVLTAPYRSAKLLPELNRPRTPSSTDLAIANRETHSDPS